MICTVVILYAVVWNYRELPKKEALLVRSESALKEAADSDPLYYYRRNSSGVQPDGEWDTVYSRWTCDLQSRSKHLAGRGRK